jgi:phosphatidate phosphatase APP1
VNKLKQLLQRLGLWLERALDAVLVWRARGRAPQLDPYRGFSTPDHLILRGRALTALRRTSPSEGQRMLKNLRQMISLFITGELADVPVVASASGKGTKTDAEGYIWLEVPREAVTPGWREVAVEVSGHPETRVNFPVLVPETQADFGIISDVDDTMIETGAYSLLRNLWTSLTGNALTRHVFPDAVALMQALHAGGRNPVFYVSSSPWNLHAFLDRIFERAGLVPGPMFLRDFGLERRQHITGGHKLHKNGAIDKVLAANPTLGFVLIGDTGQKDAHVYLEACRRHPGRIAAVILREPGPGPEEASRQAMEDIEKLGVPLLHGTAFDGMARQLSAQALPALARCL